MKIEKLPYDLTVCKVDDASTLDLTKGFYFIGRTDEEISLVCRTSEVPSVTTAREDGWKGMRIAGELDFALVGILSKIAGILADISVPIYAVSTYNTDYILVKEEDLSRALDALADSGYEIV